MELERENKRLKVLIVILLVFLVAFGGYLAYILYFTKEEKFFNIESENNAAENKENIIINDNGKEEENSSIITNNEENNKNDSKEELYMYENLAERVYINENQTVFLTLWSNNTFSYRINNKYYFGTCYIEGEYLHGIILMGEDSDKNKVILKENISLNFKITKDNEILDDHNQVTLHPANQPSRPGGGPKENFDN